MPPVYLLVGRVKIPLMLKLLVKLVSVVLPLSKNHPVYFSKHNVSETGVSLRLQVKSNQLGPIERANPTE
jgi:hypothetical protein